LKCSSEAFEKSWKQANTFLNWKSWNILKHSETYCNMEFGWILVVCLMVIQNRDIDRAPGVTPPGHNGSMLGVLIHVDPALGPSSRSAPRNRTGLRGLPLGCWPKEK
jgi:hypothetical protein